MSGATPVVAGSARRCTGCGGAVQAHDLFCTNCGAVAQPAPPAAEQAQPHALARAFRCGGCGAAIAFSAATGTLHCAFCGSRSLDELPAAKDKPAPELVLPFQVDAQRAQDLFRRWLGSLRLRPGDLKQGAQVDRLTAIYLPFWSFSAWVHSYWTADTDAPALSRADWAPVAGEHQDRHRQLLVLASAGLSAEEVAEIEPFDFSKAEKYTPDLLEGQLAEEFARRQDECEREGLRRLAEREREACAASVPGSKMRNLKVNWLASDVSAKPVLLPIHIAAYRYRDKVYRFLVNGQTGEVVGQAPYSKLKIAALIALGVLVAAALIAAGVAFSR